MKEIGVPPDSVLMGMATRIAPEKHLELLVPTLRAVISQIPDAHLLILGEAADESYNEHLRGLFRDANLLNSVTFAGYRADALRIMSTVDIALHSAHTEGFGVAILEAMALGKPVVATEVGGVPELVNNGTTGILYEPGDSEAMAAAIIELLSNPDKAHKLGAAAKKRAREHFTIDNVSRQLRQMYTQVADI